MLSESNIMMAEKMNTFMSGNNPKCVKYVKSPTFKPLPCLGWGFLVDYVAVHVVIKIVLHQNYVKSRTFKNQSA